MKVVGPFDDPNLASNILRMVPWSWQDKYELTGAMVLLSVRELVDALEHIKKTSPTAKIGDEHKTTAKSSNSFKGKWSH